MSKGKDKERILIVDDDEGTCKSLSLILGRKGYETDTAGTGGEALEKAKGKPFNLVLLDIRLADADGLELMAPLKELNPDVEIVMATGYASVENAVQALNEGAAAYLTKPFNMDEVLATIGNILEKQRLVRDKQQAEEALISSEERHRQLVENLNDVIYAVSADGEITYISPVIESVIGYSAEEVKGRSIAEYILPEDLNAAMESHLMTLSGSATAGDFRITNKSGEVRWVRTSNRPIFDGERVVGATGVLTDITERRQAEERIEHLNAVLRAIRNVNQLIIREKDRSRLLQGICDNLTETRGYHSCWAVLLDETGALVTCAEAGLGKDFKPVARRLKEGKLTKCAKRAIKKSEIILIEDVKETCKDCPIADRYEGRGGMVIRLEYEGRVYGLLAVSVPTHFAVDEEELSLFREVTSDIAFALHGIEQGEERERAEETLRASEEKYRDLVERERDVIFSVDAVGNITSINSASRIWGYEPEELIGKNFLELVPEEWQERTAVELQNLLLEAGELTAETVVVARNGEHHTIEYSATVIQEGGEYAGVRGIVRDITERKRAEEALRESEQKMRTMFSSITDGIILTDLVGNIVDVNEAAVRLHGYSSKDELIGVSGLELIAEESRAGAIEAMVKALEEGRGALMEYILLRKDGSKADGEGNTTVLDDGEGNPMGIVVITRDVTERKRAEEALRRYAEREATLHQVAQAVSQTMDMDEMLNSVLDKVCEVADTTVGGIFLLELESAEIALKAYRGVSKEFVESLRVIKMGESEIKRALEWQEPVIEPDKLFTRVNADKVAVAVEREGLRWYMLLPFWSKGIPLGALAFGDRRERQFSSDDIDLLNSIGIKIAVGIDNIQLLERTQELSVTDELTGLYNRRHFYDVLEAEMARTMRFGHPFTLVMLDLDGFKEYNDKFGHVNGDAVLKSLGQTLKSTLRKSDASFRYGGDEFTIILAGTDAQRAKQVIERVRTRWLQTPKALYPILETPLGFSAGIAQFPEHADTADGLVFMADSALYHAKEEGGYRAVLASDLKSLSPEILEAATPDHVYALASTVDAKDPYTYGHSKNVADIAQAIGKEIGMSGKELAHLRNVSLLHDIGKLGVPDAILTKPGKLTEEEWEIIKRHSADGERIVSYVKDLSPLVPMIRHHHEWYDGSGYPDGLKGEEIPLGARVISIADAYDTMTGKRPYREAVSHEESIEELKRCSGTQFDPELVEAFIRAFTGQK